MFRLLMFQQGIAGPRPGGVQRRQLPIARQGLAVRATQLGCSQVKPTSLGLPVETEWNEEQGSTERAAVCRVGGSARKKPPSWELQVQTILRTIGWTIGWTSANH